MSVELITRLNDGHPFLGRQAPDLGLSRPALRSMLRHHEARRVLHGVYVDASRSDDRELRAEALHLVMPSYGVLFGTTAAWLFGIDAFQPEERFVLTPTCVVPHGAARPTGNGIRAVEGYIAATDITEINGLRTTTPGRTAADLLRRLRRPFAMSSADALARAELISIGDLRERIDRLRGYPGIIQARELLPLINPRAESPGESWQRLRLIDAGFPAPQVQYAVIDHRGRVLARLDLAYESIRLGTEYDGAPFHSHDSDVRRDAERREFLGQAFGWRFVIARGGHPGP
ncbi:MAG: hypothetical protein ACRDP1_05620 [Nocardioidaceae bacterium]